MNRKKNLIMIFMCIAVLVMIIGYAAFATKLSITSTSNITTTWNIEITNITSSTTGEAYNIEEPSYTGTYAKFNAGFNKPGDTMKYTVTVKNKGDVSAIIDSVNAKAEGTPAIIYTIEGLEYGVRLGGGEETTFTINIEFDINATSIPSDTNKILTIDIIAIQDDGRDLTPGTAEIEGQYGAFVAAIFANNTIYADNVASEYVSSDTGIDFNYSSVNDTNGKGLYYTNTNTEDNKKVYYFRGGSVDNYVQFGTWKENIVYYTTEDYGGDFVTLESCQTDQYDEHPPDAECVEKTKYAIGDPILWRIVRINEDGSIRLVLADAVGISAYNNSSSDNAYIGYMYGTIGASDAALTHTNTTNSTIKNALDTWYGTNLSNYNSMLSTTAGFCNDRSIISGLGYGTNSTSYGSQNRTTSPQFACPNPDNDLFTVTTSTTGNKKLTNPVGLLTLDELIYAGGQTPDGSQSYYLAINKEWCTISPYSNNSVWCMNEYDELDYLTVTNEYSIRPVINLLSSVGIESNDATGSYSKPYVIVTN